METVNSKVILNNRPIRTDRQTLVMESDLDLQTSKGVIAPSSMAEKWILNAVMAIFVFLTSIRYISTKMIDSTEVVDVDGKTV